jgi:hypothetical protein
MQGRDLRDGSEPFGTNAGLRHVLVKVRVVTTFFWGSSSIWRGGDGGGMGSVGGERRTLV